MAAYKRALSKLILSVFYFMTSLFIVGCGDDFDPTTASAPHPIDITPVTSSENPKVSLGLDPSIALGSDGFLRIAYYDLSNGNLKFARCADTACATPVITTVDSTGDVGANSSLFMATGTDGFARISYYDTSNGDLKFARCTDADCTSPTLTTVETTGNVGSSSSLAIGSDGFARISYYDASNGVLRFALCSTIDCTAPTLTTVGPGTGIGGAESDIVLGADGFARISHWNLSSLDLDYVRCTNAACSSTPTNATLDATGTSPLGAGSSISLGTDGFPRITYLGEESVLTQDGTSSLKGQIKFAQCDNDDCTNPTITIVDSSSRFGATTSHAIAADGFARIAYFDQENGVLKFSRCINAACTSPVITTVDSTQVSGDFPSLLIGTDGFAKIAYFYHTNGDLKIAQCVNLDCTSNNIATIDR